jgi:hypothetical protein
VWAEDYDQYKTGDAQGYGKAASSASYKQGGYGGYGGYGHGASGAAAQYGASKGAYGSYGKASGSDFDSYGRDQDLDVKESYSKTNAKSYGA